jgi:hypothetical protein
VDFLMEDVTTYDDAQVGAAARVVHEGCQSALNIDPLSASKIDPPCVACAGSP